uniref:DDE_Tnp_1_7 domain-containing protein n=1 Tax=Caenorhabditis tropicalis TaxID=1561998 RepID=A0A1I7TTV3_9PELO
MPRSKRRYYAPLIPSSDSFSEDNSSSELDNHDEISGDESVQWDHFDNDENNQNEERSDLFRELHEASDEVITFLGSACLARSSDSGGKHSYPFLTDDFQISVVSYLLMMKHFVPAQKDFGRTNRLT